MPIISVWAPVLLERLLHAALMSVVSHGFHPIRPVVLLDTAGHGPGTMNVIVLMPFECPQLFEIDFPDRPIQESTIYRCVVPVKTDTPHFIATGAMRIGLMFRRPVN